MRKIRVIPRHFFAAIFILFAIVAAAIFIFYSYLRKGMDTPLSANAAKRMFVVLPGQDARQVAGALYGGHFIASAFAFEEYANITGEAQRIQPGSYEISPSMAPRQILLEIIAAQENQIKITIREGWDIDDIANYLAAQNVVPKGVFVAAEKEKAQTFDYFGENPRVRTLEGYLFPDTYFIPKGKPAAETADDILDKMLANTKEKINAAMLAQIHAQHKTVYDILTLASIIEREVGRNKNVLTSKDVSELQNEREIVAGIFYNRIEAGMPLQSDATVDFAKKILGLPQSTPGDKVNSAYNTYLYVGLPPGPIANPSLNSIEAAINPAKTDYLYFLTRSDGTAVFARTLQEQEANAQKYLGR